MTAGAGELTNYYRPLPVTLLLLQYQLWGPHPLGYHAFSILLHLAVTTLLFLWTERIAGRKAAFWTALLFTLHPIHNETVNYADHFEGILAMVFGLGALLLRQKRRFCSLIALALSLLCKEEGAVFIPIIALFEWYRPINNDEASGPWSRRFMGLWPEFLVFSCYAGLRLTVFNFLHLPIGEFGAQQGAYGGLALRLLTFAKALVVYLRLLILPMGLHFDRDMPPASSPADPWAWGALVLGAAILSLLWRWSAKAGRWGLLWFLAALLPYCGLLPFNNLLAEHFLYIPSAGIFLTAVLLAEGPLGRLPRLLSCALVAALLGFYGAQGLRRNRDWQDPVRIYLSTLAGNPGSYRAANNLGTEYYRKGKLSDARSAFDASLRANPAYHPALNNVGAVVEAEGRLAEALQWYLRSAQAQPDYALAHKNAACICQNPVARKTYRFQVQGPNAMKVMEKVLGAKPPELKFFNMTTVTIAGKTVT
ncbi:MAG: tetratricopeptide repeat protein, partial [Elusimicrobiota bacterium]